MTLKKKNYRLQLFNFAYFSSLKTNRELEEHLEESSAEAITTTEGAAESAQAMACPLAVTGPPPLGMEHLQEEAEV